MRELKDSSDIAHDPDLLRTRIRRDGYVFFRGLLDPEPIRALASRVLRALQAEDWLEPGPAPERARLRPPARDFKNQNFYGGYTALQSQEYFHALPHSPELTSVMAGLIGPDVFIHPRKVGRLVWPTGMGTTPGIYTHQDFVVEGVPDMFTSWVPFVDCSRDLGGLSILTGSQNEGVVARLHQVDPDDERWATTDYRVGDVLVFHCLTAHAALPNRTDGLRLSGDYRWQSAGQALPSDALLPHLHGSVPGWDELTRGWDSTAWVDPPTGVDVVDRLGGEMPAIDGSPFVSVPVQTDRDREHVVLAGMFNNMRDGFRPEHATRDSAVIEYRITSHAGAHQWQVAVDGGNCRIDSDGEDKPDVAITTGFRDYLEIVGGRLDPARALADGRLAIEGDLEIALEQTQWFRDR
ncbi:phytanoyl-CoA dioxygenase family protein [Nocardiopsis aegyptia]|uniref:phytanoyl-CoA dioxygenase family protein n=1 Tax=Nocardiopsis aegyptia TaxID=220378 RepID=UPI00366A729E